jgi:hypothetical protein
LPRHPVLPEAEGQIVVSRRLEQGKRAFQMLSRFGVLSSEPMRGPCYAVSCSCRSHVGPASSSVSFLRIAASILSDMVHDQSFATRRHGGTRIVRAVTGPINNLVFRLKQLCA